MDPRQSITTVVQITTVTSGPEINNQQFQGWYIHKDDNFLEAINCPESQSLLITKNYAQCCSIGATTCSVFWTSCVGARPVGVNTDICNSSSVCQTVSIFDQFPVKDAPVYSQIICAVTGWGASSIYRTVITTTSSTSLSTITAASTSQQATINTVASTQSRTKTSNTSTSQTTPTSTSAPDPSPPQVLIVGAVIGAVAAIAIIGLLYWVLRSRRKRQHNSSTRSAMAPVECTYGKGDQIKFQISFQDETREMHNIQQKIYEMHADYPSKGLQELPGSERARPR